MINVNLLHRNGKFIKVKVYGHSGYDISGRDIVCAAVSSITQSIIIGLEKVISKDFYYNIDSDGPMVYIDISKYSSDNIDKAQILLNTFKYTLEEIIRDYGKYVKLKIKEDNNYEI